MCVGSVCTHLPYNNKNPPSGFYLIHKNNIHFYKSSHSQLFVCVMSHMKAAPTIVDWCWCFTLDPPWVSCNSPTSIVSMLEQGHRHCKPGASMSGPPPPPPPERGQKALDIRDAIHSAVHTLYSRSHHLSFAPSPSHLELTENPCNVMYAQKSNCTCLISFEMSQCAW